MAMENLDIMLEKIAKNVELFKNDNKKLNDKINTLLEVLNGVKDNAKAINSTTSEIKNISDTTNILSVNASIEAARAGEAGKGFSVVAQEMYTLANTTKSSSEQVFVLLKELNKKVDAISEEVNGIHTLQDEQAETFAKILDAYDEIGKAVEAENE